MKQTLIFWNLILALFTQLSGQEFCRPILEEARSALLQRNVNQAQEKLQDASTCDYKNALILEIQKVQRRIFSAIQAQKQEAVRARAVAEEQRLLAESALNEAEKQRNFAQKAEQEAVRQQMLTVCRSMALKSIYNSDKRMKSLLSLQAFRFYRRDSVFGQRHNGAIFEALYQARKSLREGETNRIQLGESLGRHELAFDKEKAALTWSTPEGNVYRNPFGGTVFETGDTLPEMQLLSTGRENSVEVKLHPQCEFAAYLLRENRIRVASLDTPSGLSIELAHEELVRFWGFDSRGSYLLIADAGGEVCEWDFRANKVVNKVDFREELKEVQSDPIEGRMYACGASGSLLFQGLGNRIERLGELGSDKAETLTFRKEAGGCLMAVGTREGRIYLFRLKPGGIEKPLFLRKLDGHVGRITSLDFSGREDPGNGQVLMNYLASSSMDETVRLWDLSEEGKYELPIVLDDYQSWVWQLRFSPDNRFIVAVAQNGWLRKVPLQMEDLARDLCSGIQTNFTEEEWKIHVSRDWIPWEATCLDETLLPQKK